MPVDYEVIKELRRDRKLKQEDIGRILGIRASTYSSYESGRRRMTIELLEAIADILGTSTDYILGRTTVENPYPPRNKQ